MLLLDILFIILIPLLLVGVFVGGLGWRRVPGEGGVLLSAFFLFVFVLLGVWAAYLWVPPMGPVVGDVAWLPLLIVGLAVALLIAAAVPPASRRVEVVTPEPPTVPAAEVFGLFFWVTVILLGALIVIALVRA